MIMQISGVNQIETPHMEVYLTDYAIHSFGKPQASTICVYIYNIFMYYIYITILLHDYTIVFFILLHNQTIYYIMVLSYHCIIYICIYHDTIYCYIISYSYSYTYIKYYLSYIQYSIFKKVQQYSMTGSFNCLGTHASWPSSSAFSTSLTFFGLLCEGDKGRGGIERKSSWGTSWS